MIPRNNYGFTFIELVLVITITVVTSMIVVPQFGLTLNSVHSEVATNKLMDDIRYTQNFAVTNHCNTWFSVDLANNSYSYGFYATPPSSDPQLITDPATNGTSVVSLDVYPNIQITNETLSGNLNFDWFGHPSAGATITLNSSINISISSETGYVVKN